MSFGASPCDWDALGYLAGLLDDLLPVVSNPTARISSQSSLSATGKTPSCYNPGRQVVGFRTWTQHHATPAEVAQWATQPDYGICIQTRHLRALDVDVTDPQQAALIDEMIAVHGAFPHRRRVNSSKFLVAFWLEGDYSKRVMHCEGGMVEFLATGQQFVAVGTHPSGARYEWDGGTPDGFPTLTADEFTNLWGALVYSYATEKPTTAKTTTRHQQIAQAAEADPVGAYLISAGLVRGTGPEGRLDITCPWSDRHTTQDTVSSTSYFPAHTGGYAMGHFACLHAHCADRSDEDFRIALGAPSVLDEFDIISDTVDPTEPAAPPKNERFTAIPAHEFAVGKPPEWIIRGLLPKAEIAMLFGESGSGKTFVALDLAASIARGIPWQNHKVKQGRVVYVAAEGVGGLRTRLQAYAEGHDCQLVDLKMAVIPAAPNLLERQQTIDIIQAIRHAGGADVVFLDTMAQVTAGSNENSGEDMGKLLSHCRAIHEKTGALIVLIHHSGKDSSRGARGWSGVRGAMDAELEVTYDGKHRELAVTKQKDGSDEFRIGFTLNPQDLGTDDEGEPITSCTVSYHKAAIRPAGMRQDDKDAKIYAHVTDYVGEVLSSGLGGGIDANSLATAVAARLPEPAAGGRDTRHGKALIAIQTLEETGVLVSSGGFITGLNEKT